MQFERYHTKNRKRAIKQHIKYFNFRDKAHFKGKTALASMASLSMRYCERPRNSCLLALAAKMELRMRWSWTMGRFRCTDLSCCVRRAFFILKSLRKQRGGGFSGRSRRKHLM